MAVQGDVSGLVHCDHKQLGQIDAYPIFRNEQAKAPDGSATNPLNVNYKREAGKPVCPEIAILGIFSVVKLCLACELNITDQRSTRWQSVLASSKSSMPGQLATTRSAIVADELATTARNRFVTVSSCWCVLSTDQAESREMQ